jgi:tRNA-dihydrouridine synthase B
MKLPFKNKYLLAPMEEVNDIAFRLLCKKAGCGMTYTGMIHPLSQKKIYLNDKPALQIFCSSPKGVRSFVKKYDKNVSLWDFNLGCPAKSAKKHGFGSFLKDFNVIEEILKRIRESTKKPLSVKFRKSKDAFKVLDLAKKYCDMVSIHPRTQVQGYSGKPDVLFAKKIKKSCSLPVVYSGNVDLKNHKTFLKDFDYVMLGRNAIGNPCIFSELINKKCNISFLDYLKLGIKYKLPFRQLKFQAMNFTKRLKNAKELRLKIFKIKDLEGLRRVFY